MSLPHLKPSGLPSTCKIKLTVLEYSMTWSQLSLFAFILACFLPWKRSGSHAKTLIEFSICHAISDLLTFVYAIFSAWHPTFFMTQFHPSLIASFIPSRKYSPSNTEGLPVLPLCAQSTLSLLLPSHPWHVLALPGVRVCDCLLSSRGCILLNFIFVI